MTPEPTLPSTPSTAAPAWVRILAPALALSIGWGIRGNYGHEMGAMLPGCLAALAAVILSGRADWIARAPYFGALGAIGWSFGGSISYMQVIGYTHSGYWDSQLYGFAMLFIIGFLWGAIGGAGTALPAVLDRKRLSEIFLPFLLVWIVWWIRDIVEDPYLNNWAGALLGKSYLARGSDFRQDEPLYWLDTDWVSAALAILTVGGLTAIRKQLCFGSRLILWMAAGWWVAFLLFPNLLGWRMTPPRGDSWAGNLGMVGGMLLFLHRNRLPGAVYGTLVAGLIGGVGFASGQMLKLIELKIGHSMNPPWTGNYHSVLEQSYGFINGIGIGVMMLYLSRRSRPPCEEPAGQSWTLPAAAIFSAFGVAFLNLRRNPEEWMKAQSMAENLYWLSPLSWYYVAWAVFALAGWFVWKRHQREPIAIGTRTPLSFALWMTASCLWIMVIGNFERALPKFAEQRMITEYIIYLNALLLSALLLIFAREPHPNLEPPAEGHEDAAIGVTPWIRNVVVAGSVACALSILMNLGVARLLWGNEQAPHSGRHIRFGPDNTTQPPKKGEKHS